MNVINASSCGHRPRVSPSMGSSPVFHEPCLACFDPCTATCTHALYHEWGKQHIVFSCYIPVSRGLIKTLHGHMGHAHNLFGENNGNLAFFLLATASGP